MKENWQIQLMYSNLDEIEKDLNQIVENTKRMQELSKDPKQNLLDILQLMEKGSILAEKLLVYSSMKKDEDSRVSQSQRIHGQASKNYSDFASSLAFLRPYLLSLDEESQNKLLEDPAYDYFKKFLKEIFRYKEHTLSEKEEFLLSKLAFANEAPGEIYYYLTNADLKFPDLSDGRQLTNSNFTLLQKEVDASIRKEAFEKFYMTYKSFGNTFATSYYNNVRLLTTQAELRSFPSARSMELFEDDVDVSVYDALLASVKDYQKYLHRYYKKKKEFLGLEEQHMYDVYLPLVKGKAKKYSYEEAVDLCIASVAPLGKEYQDIYRSAFEDGWIDVYPRLGKASGAYSSGSYKSYPYILLNFDGSLDSVFTLAHEMGHSMHSYYAKNNNPFLYYGYTIFAAEVASTFNENLLLEYLKNNAKTKEEKLLLLDHHLDSFKSTVFRQTMFAEFEHIVHAKIEKGEVLTQDDFDQIYKTLNKNYYGEDLMTDDLISHEWMRIPHFYRNFYVYKYATGYCAATILSKGVLEEGEEKVKDYIRFLKDGSNHFPIDQLKMAGCDMRDQETVNKALEVFGSLVEELEDME